MNAGVLLLVPVASFTLFASIVLQCYCFYACLRVYKELMQPLDSGLPTNDNRRPFLQERTYVSLSAEPNQPASGFIPFGGEGRRLG